MREYMKIVESALVEAGDDKRPELGVRDKAADLQFDMPHSKGELTSPSKSANLPTGTVPPGKRAKGKPKVKASPEVQRQVMQHFATMNTHELGDLDAPANGHDAHPGAPSDGDIPDVDTTPQNLPAVINTAIAAEGSHIEPEWHQVKDLPMAMQQVIRTLARQVFAQFTDTPVDQIQMLCTMTNPENEVKYTMAWLRQNGIRDDKAEMDFTRLFPQGYRADVQLWRTQGYEFLLVKDFGGYYVYGWPGGRGVHLGNNDTKRLESADPELDEEVVDFDAERAKRGMAHPRKTSPTQAEKPSMMDRLSGRARSEREKERWDSYINNPNFRHMPR